MTTQEYEKPPIDLILRRAFEWPWSRRKRQSNWEQWKREHWDPEPKTVQRETVRPIIDNNVAKQLIERATEAAQAIPQPEPRLRALAEIGRFAALTGNEQLAESFLSEASTGLASVKGDQAQDHILSLIASARAAYGHVQAPGRSQGSETRYGGQEPRVTAEQLTQSARSIINWINEQGSTEAPASEQPSRLPESELQAAVERAHAEGFTFGAAIAADAPALWLEAVEARKPRMPSDLEARLLQGSVLPIDALLRDEVRHALRDGFFDGLRSSITTATRGNPQL